MAPGQSSVVFHRPIGGVRRRPLADFLNELSRLLGNGREVACLIAGDRELEAMNRKFRKKNSATDVLSFSSTRDGSLGDIAISFDRARQQAKELAHPVEDELRILMLHGMLHLAGFDHATDRGEMARAERRLRRKFGLPTGLIERARGPA